MRQREDKAGKSEQSMRRQYQKGSFLDLECVHPSGPMEHGTIRLGYYRIQSGPTEVVYNTSLWT